MSHLRILAVAALAGTAVTVLPASATAAPACDPPAAVIGLSKDWKVQLPIDDPDKSGKQPLEVKQPKFATYSKSPWFTPTAACDGIQFRAAVNGVTTSNSSYPRSELREMTDDGRDEAAWSSTSGTHTMVIDQAITHLPKKKPHVVAGQIHDGENDRSVFRLEGTKLYITKENDKHTLITDDYRLGTRFQAKFVVSGGNIRAYYNGELKATIPAKFSGGYFKAGAYTQANCDKSDPCESGNYGQTVIYSVKVTHS
ncbi:polysaccharide lyase family 7 protein [Amycolatopsis suaedae]|uniref:polysaccharide lyase family 7 protein n=1 Tax=Amycolatopsis suaedae TaxID=2510978 RepID=UPI001F0EA2D1|nr:polysaccharide lyase family 7 protein [Amycolatopsis suaedae]